MSEDADWRDVTPTTPGFEFEVQQNRKTGEARHRTIMTILMSVPEADIIPAGDWISGWPGKGLQW